MPKPRSDPAALALIEAGDAWAAALDLRQALPHLSRRLIGWSRVATERYLRAIEVASMTDVRRAKHIRTDRRSTEVITSR